MRLWHLTPDYAESWREIRLEMLKAAPEAFGSRYEDWCDAPLSSFRQRLEQARHFAAGDDDKVPLAVACWQAGKVPEDPQRGWVMSVYARPAARGRGHVDAVLRRIAEDARAHGMTSLGLHVVKTNAPAQQLYRRLGYADSGVAGVANDMGIAEDRLLLQI